MQIRPFIVRFTIPLFLLFCWSCSDELDNPGNIIPPEDLLNAVFTDTCTVTAFIEKDDTVRTDNVDRAMLGSYYDPVFGRTSAAFYTTLNINQKINNRQDLHPMVDSVVLCLRFDGAYGDVSKYNGYQVAEVFEVTQEIPLPTISDPGYHSYNSFSYNPVPLGVHGFAPQFFPYKNEPSQMRIRLNNDFGQRFIQLDSLSPDTIVHFCKGLFVRISPMVTGGQSPGQGAISYFKLGSDVSRVSIYFHNDDTQPNQTPPEIRLSMNGKNVHFTVFNHDNYASADPGLITKLNDTTDTSGQFLYLQSIQGLRIKVKFPTIQGLVSDTQKVIINKAELLLPVDISQNTVLYPMAASITTYRLDEDGDPVALPDNGYAYWDSFYDGTNKRYRFGLAQYIQQVLSGEIPNNGFYVDIKGEFKSYDAYRMVLHSVNHLTNPIKLNLTYTRIKNL